ncbi:serpin B3 [Tetranychus urticae]|uniref:Serpin domain-containing protein n=1 Tax=Tetranychus urticae TaxID=32264 RepID=T1L0W4_TETUR|nr:serpin B3 [Tetranychus urticae]
MAGATISRWLILVTLLSPGLLVFPTFSQVISFGMRKLAYSTNQFGFDLLRAMDKSESSTAFCPICISSSLTMMLMGSQGHTSTALRHALYLWGMQTSEINLAYHDMMTHLGVNVPNSVHYRNLGPYGPSPASDYRVSIADNEANTGNDIAFLSHVYVQRDFGINYSYHMLLQRFYKTAIRPLDFIDNGEETRQHINAIVEKETSGKIKDILPDRQSPTTQLLLLSALYFKGSLDLNITSSRKRNYIAPSSSSSAYKQLSGASSNLLGVFSEDSIILEARNVRIRYGFNRFLNCTTIEMPFKGGLITLVAMMPHDPYGLDTLLTRLSAQVLSDVINSLEVRRVDVKIPRLHFETSDRNLSLSLANLGVAYIFKPGYSQLYDISDYKWLHVSDIIHKTYLEIWENPKTFTNTNINSINTNGNTINSNNVNNNNGKSQYQSSNNIEVVFDKPFLFFIMDNISGLILAMGKHGREPVNYRLPI